MSRVYCRGPDEDAAIKCGNAAINGGDADATMAVGCRGAVVEARDQIPGTVAAYARATRCPVLSECRVLCAVLSVCMGL
eukprot:186550-Rhodomonas_salina.2